MAMKRSSSRGIGNFVWYLIVVALIVAFLKIPSHQSASGIAGYFDGKSETIKIWVDSWAHTDFAYPDMRLQK